MFDIIFYFFNTYTAEIVSGGATAFGSLLVWIFQARVKLVWGLSHGYNHRLNVPTGVDGGSNPLFINTASHIISNLGRKSANKVEATFVFPPEGFEIFPPRNFDIRNNPNGKFIVQFDTVAPKERIYLNLVSVGRDVPMLVGLRSCEATGKPITLITQRYFPKSVQFFVSALLFLGAASAMYLLIQLIGLFSTLANMA